MNENDKLDPRLQQAGEAVARLSKATPSSDLVARTMTNIHSKWVPVKRVFWMLRPITHPLARVAAAALIIFTLSSMINMELADPIGSHIERRIVGRTLVGKVENLIDRVLVRNGPPAYLQTELDALMGIERRYTSMSSRKSQSRS